MYGNVKGNLNDNIDNNYDFLLYEVGINIKVNDVNRRAIIIDNTEKPADADTKIIIADFQLNQGDLIFYNNTNWLIVTEIDTSKNTYRAKMNKCNFNIKFSYTNTTETYSYDYEVPVLVRVGTFSIDYSQYINLPDGEAYVTVRQDDIINPLGLTTDIIKLNYKFIKWGHTFEVAGIDKTKKGLITFHATLASSSGDDTQMINESFNYDKIYSIDVTNSIDTLKMGNTYKPTVAVYLNEVNIVDKVPIYYTAVTDDTISVDENGIITPIKAGQAIVKIFSQGVSKYIEFDIEAINYSIEILNKIENIGMNYTYALNINCYKDGVKDTSPLITYTSSNTNIAIINSDGVITGIGSGTVSIIATYNGVSDTMNVNIIPINTIAITNKVNQLKVGQTYTPTVDCTSNNVVDTNPTLTYTISDSSILSIENEVITVLKAGTATLVVAYKDVIDSVTIVCTNVTYGISIINKPSSALSNGSTLQLNISCTQDNVVDTNPTVTYASSNTNVLSISNTGLINCISSGVATITAIYNGISDSVDINVDPAHVYELAVSPTSINIDNESTLQLTASVTDKGITLSSPTITYLSNNTSIATVNSTGLVTATGVGTCNVTCIFIGKDSQTYSQVVSITVTQPVAKTVTFTTTYNNAGDITSYTGSGNPFKLLNFDTAPISVFAYRNGVKQSDVFSIAASLEGGNSTYYTLNVIDGNNFSVKNNKGDGGEYLTITATNNTDNTSKSITIRLAGEW